MRAHVLTPARHKSTAPRTLAQVLAMLRKGLEPTLIELKMTWGEAKPLLSAATEGGVSGMLERAQALLGRVAGGGGGAAATAFMLELAGKAADAYLPVAVRLLRSMLASAIGRTLGLGVADVLPLVSHLDTLPKLQAALRDPQAFTTELAGSPAASQLVRACCGA